ncbi:hypothetical protein ET475_13495 [Microbacterium protaetiae]|uniref:Uncharacterized protein n=1 Tax=Microbacterium protaetiae TaxID=2509458 RepID=A0A4P6EEY1_9MICO|nr:hypothetical protein [Microbacterium protaetiae]QAY60902.1 hypothetical protein ET475_13495 [Microbacterium protaetiae]
MRTSRTPTTRLSRGVVALAICLVAVGLIVVVLSAGFDWHGFAGGLALGAGIGTMLVGAYFWGWMNGLRRQGSSARWLPGEEVRR